MTRKIELPNFASEVRALVGKDRTLPPVEKWQPEREGEIDILIARDGTWYYQDEPMERESIVQLFSTILRKDGTDYFLVTPVEKMKIQVEDAPFVVRMLDVDGEGKDQKLNVSTNVGDVFTIDEGHPIQVEYDENDQPSPYVVVRSNLRALVNRQVYYELADLAVESESDPESYGVYSAGCFFRL